MDRLNILAMLKRVCCPGCLGTLFNTLVDEPYDAPGIAKYLSKHYSGRARLDFLYGQKYQLDRCKECGLVFQRFVPQHELLSEIYDIWIPNSERDRLYDSHTLNTYRYLAEQVQFMIWRLNMKPSAIKVLDFGLGWAEWAAMAKAFGCQVYGAELSTARIEHARSLGIEIVDYADLVNHKFNYINTEQVFEHLLEPYEVLLHLSHSLAHNGIIKISVPNAAKAIRKAKHQKSLGSLSAKEIMPIAPLEHINCFEHATLVTMANSVGLRLLWPSLYGLYNSSLGWLEPKRALNLLIRPLYRHVYPKSTFLYFVRADH